MSQDYCSIIMVCFRKGAHQRSYMFGRSLSSLLNYTTYPYELILIDNTQNNRGLGAARNLGYSISTGKYVAIVDDDIEFKEGWLEDCIAILQLSGKYIATPIHTLVRGHMKFELPKVLGYTQNRRAGSNCLVMRKSSYDEIGGFPNIHPGKDGVIYCDTQNKKGYTVLRTYLPKAIDLGYKKHSYDGQLV